MKYSREAFSQTMHMRCAVVFVMSVIACPLPAQEVPHPCVKVIALDERLACYDAAFPRPPEIIEAGMRHAEASFGLNRPRSAQSGSEYQVERADSDGFESRVIKVDYGRNGQRSFGLENGQVWTQAEGRAGGHVQDGEVVQVRKGLMGSYQLITSAGVVLRVRRAR